MEDVEEEEESAEGLFPSERGGKNNQENILLREKKKDFSPLLGHNEECKFLN